MRNFFVTQCAVLSVLVSLTLGACTQKTAQPVRQVSPQEAAGLLRNDFAVLVDVREQDEVDSTGMAAQARHAPQSKIEANEGAWKEFVAELPKDKEIVLYCASGGRAGKIAEKLSKEGFKTGNMGGFEDSQKAGLPVTKPAAQ